MARLVLLAAPLAALAVDHSSSSTSTLSAQQRPAGPGRFLSDPKVRACLEKQGVTFPNRDRRNSAQFEKLRAALQKCGVTFPKRGAPPPSSQGTPSTSAS